MRTCRLGTIDRTPNSIIISNIQGHVSDISVLELTAEDAKALYRTIRRIAILNETRAQTVFRQVLGPLRIPVNFEVSSLKPRWIASCHH